MEKSYNIIIEKMQTWLESFISMVPNIALCILLLFGFWLLAKLSRKLVLKVIRKFFNNVALNNLIGTIVFITVMCIGFFVALSVLKLDKAVTSLLAGAGVIGLALGFAFQDSATNFISGVFMALRKPFKIGDIISSADQMGMVEKINLRNIIMHSFQGQEVIIPNKDVFQNKIINYTSLGNRRVDINVGVSYNDDLEKVKKIAIEAIKKLDFVNVEKKVALFFSEFGGSSINFSIQFWIDYPDQPGFLKAQSEGIIAIKKAFDKNDISIPFPIRTLDIDTAKLKHVFSSENKPKTRIDE